MVLDAILGASEFLRGSQNHVFGHHVEQNEKRNVQERFQKNLFFVIISGVDFI